MDFARAVVREPDVSDVAHYRRRVLGLCIIHPSLFATAVTGIVLLAWRGRFFVTLAQRSNVETLVLAFFLLLFAYVASLTAPGAWGAARLGWYRARGAWTRDRARADRARVAALGPPARGPSVATNRALERADRPGAPFELALADELGAMGKLRIDGVRIDHLEARGGGSNNLFAFFLRQVCDVTGVPPEELDVVAWRSIDETSWRQYVAGAAATRALGRRLGDDAVWPRVVVTAQQCDALERRLSALCEPLRDEGFLPHWEFQGEHKLPIIPEPLGIVSLSRSERRVDPLSSLLATLVVLGLSVALIITFIMRPPWLPGR